VRPTGLQRRLAAILAADVAGYSRLMAADESGTFGQLKANRQEVVDPAIAGHDGRIVKLMGDGLLVEFASVVDAVECAAAVQRGMAVRNAPLPGDRRMALRIGVHLGDVIVEEGDIFGDGVNVAARLEGLAEPGGIALSGDVRNAVRGKVELTLEDLGERALKNIETPVRVYRVPAVAFGVAAAGPARQQPTAAARASRPDKPSIAVLPFDNMSDDPEQAYFSDGIAEDLITDLSKISGLFVIARNSAFIYKGRAVDLREVSRELGVRYVLEGSVRKAGKRVRITAQLIDGATGGHLWAERYDREWTDIFAVQDELTQQIVSALRIKLTTDEGCRVHHRGTDDIEAYDFFLRGRDLLQRRTFGGIVQSRPLLEKSIDLDPAFAAAYAGLAFGYALEYVNCWTAASAQALDTAFRLARQAVALDAAEPQARYAMAMVHLWRREHEPAIQEARTAIELDPNFAPGFSLLGLALHYAGRSEEALGMLERAMQLNPYYPDAYLHFVAQSHFALLRYTDAEAALQRRLVRNPDTDISRVLLAACYGHLGRKDEAGAAWKEALRVNPEYSLEHRQHVLPYKNPADFDRIVEGLRKAGLPV
jgi:TolB-like protein/Tfp pilus assembly protein PilF